MEMSGYPVMEKLGKHGHLNSRARILTEFEKKFKDQPVPDFLKKDRQKAMDNLFESYENLDKFEITSDGRKGMDSIQRLINDAIEKRYK